MKLEKKFLHKGYYNASGVRIPNVTTVAKLISAPEGLIHWAWQLGIDGKDYKEERDNAATAGHIAHSRIECLINNRTWIPDDTVPQEIVEKSEMGYNAFLAWMAGTKFQLIKTEVQVISERYQYGGRLDCIANVNDEPCIVDWKTSKGRDVRDAWLPQVAAYRQGWNETHRDQPIKGCHFMVLSKADAGFSHHYFPSSTIDVGWRAFLACLELYDCRKEVNKLL